MKTKDLNFLNSDKTQAECTKSIIEELNPYIEHFLYHISRYDVPITLVLIYTKADIEKYIIKNKRLSDIEKSIKLDCGYFNFIFLPFTDNEHTHGFVKTLEKDFLNNYMHHIHYEELKHENHNTYNFINSYLYAIADLVACNGDFVCNVPRG